MNYNSKLTEDIAFYKNYNSEPTEDKAFVKNYYSELTFAKNELQLWTD